jgi:outer membrane protein assembly factor BamB
VNPTRLRRGIFALVPVVGLIIGSTSRAATPPPERSNSAAIRSNANWPRFRGPNGSGIGQGDIPAKWGDEDFNWKVKLPGGGNSSPVVWGDRIFLTCGNDQTGAEMVVCLNTSDGQVRWKREYPSRSFNHHPYNSYASGSAAVDEKHVFVCWSTPESLTLLALDPDGKELWKKDLGPFVSQHGGGQSPMIFEGLVVLTDDQEGPQSFLFAFHEDSGELAWKVDRKPSNKFAAATPCVYRPKNGPAQLIFAGKSEGLTAIDPKTGNRLWELPDIFDARPVASPYTAEGLIFASCGDGPTGHQFVAAKPADDGKSATIAYEYRRGVPYVPTSIVKDGLLYYVTDNGVLTCAHANTGQQIWRQRLDGNFFGSFVNCGDKLFLLSKEGEAFVFRAGEKFELLAQNKLDWEDDAPHPPLSTTPAIAGGRMYVRTYTHLVSIGGK